MDRDDLELAPEDLEERGELVLDPEDLGDDEPEQRDTVEDQTEDVSTVRSADGAQVRQSDELTPAARDGWSVLILSIITLGLYPLYFVGSRVREHLDLMAEMRRDLQEIRELLKRQAADDDQETN